MNLTELSHLSTVINQLKTVINTAGHARFPKDTLTTLKKRVMQLEDKFVGGICELSDSAPAKQIYDRIAQAKAELAPVGTTESVEKAKSNVVMSSDGGIVIEPAQSEPEPAMPATAPEVQFDVTSRAVMVKPPVDINVEGAEALVKIDPSIGARLAEEKKKLVSKGKRKTAK